MELRYFHQFSSIFAESYPPAARDPRLLIAAEGDIAVYYSAMEYVPNPQARLVLIGITPGPTQMENANHEAYLALQQGVSTEEALLRAKKRGAFSGEPMRSNLIQQLNHWGFQHWLGLQDATELFSSARHYLQTASLLRYPVFVAGEPYNGKPAMTKHPLLRKFLIEHFVAEINQMPNVLLVPLGQQVLKVLTTLANEKLIDGSLIAQGMVHPSGQNTYRIRYLVGEREKPVPHATNYGAYDAGRGAFQKKFLDHR